MAVCQYWDCDQVIRGDHFLCYDHYDDFQGGAINPCPSCGKFKDVHYERCLPCSQGQRSRAPRGIEHEEAWERKDATATEWFVYILKLDGSQRFYVGQTRDLEERMTEHQDGKTASTRGLRPRLVYFERHPSRAEVELREAELKDIANRNEREIRKLITRFQNYLERVHKF
ncbi:MAG: GIY-YIG nuclease family protein [Chloroflexi bacterium]|nr:GIY-YIG nuclease family protein [Chloroflexota bacterium]